MAPLASSRHPDNFWNLQHKFSFLEFAESRELILTEADAVIIEQARKGDPVAWENWLFVIPRESITSAIASWEEELIRLKISTGVFIKVLENINSYNAETGQFATWLMMLAAITH
jgi:hypothetical protein